MKNILTIKTKIAIIVIAVIPLIAYSNQQPSLFKAVKTGSVDEVKALIKAGVNVNKKSNGKTALHLAARYNKNPEVITALIKAGAKVNANFKIITFTERHSFDYGTSFRENYLLDYGTALHLAAKYNKNSEVIIALLKAGVKVNAKADDGKTALHYAAEYNKNPKVITALLKAGADVNAKTKKGRTALHHAAENNKNPNIITALIKAGARVDNKVINLTYDNENLNQDTIDLLEKALKQQQQ